MRFAKVYLALAVAMVSACSETGGSSAGSMATTLPTLGTMTPGQTLMYDDGKCPEGEIASFHKRSGQNRMTRTCVDRPA